VHIAPRICLIARFLDARFGWPIVSGVVGNGSSGEVGAQADTLTARETLAGDYQEFRAWGSL
jgi:hypothetical protein